MSQTFFGNESLYNWHNVVVVTYIEQCTSNYNIGYIPEKKNTVFYFMKYFKF